MVGTLFVSGGLFGFGVVESLLGVPFVQLFYNWRSLNVFNDGCIY